MFGLYSYYKTLRTITVGIIGRWTLLSKENETVFLLIDKISTYSAILVILNITNHVSFSYSVKCKWKFWPFKKKVKGKQKIDVEVLILCNMDYTHNTFRSPLLWWVSVNI